MLNLYLTSDRPGALHLVVLNDSPEVADACVRRAGYDQALRLDGIGHTETRRRAREALMGTTGVPRGVVLTFTLSSVIA
jgi:hypothetical protein